MNQKTRAHHQTMARVLIMQALVEIFSRVVPGIVYFAGKIAIKEDRTLLLLLIFSCHSSLESLVLISTTPLYRRILKQRIMRKHSSKVMDSVVVYSRPQIKIINS
ncbi:hypothetical protein PMAYCL1PPCAC_09281 [Pristionchus mayeri]|uniref:G protein-coupled receptor n=1 Tax=Pristionchus mayeri TaxID=1317129 RepID=A0AAN4ZHC8_9BILA|nr:hypothetical protein PMAYCL1PPCAC_09281 [Pristionchus mayeri]